MQLKEIEAFASLVGLSNVEFSNSAEPNVIPIRAYLDQTVIPILLQGLTQLAHEVCYQSIFSFSMFHLSPFGVMKSEFLLQRPTNPVQWLGHYLLKNDPARRLEEEAEEDQ